MMAENTWDRLTDQIERHEGLRLKPYRCTSGKLTIGVGRNLEGRGILKSEADFLLYNDLEECHADLVSIFPNFNTFCQNRQIALIDLRFNLGHSGFRTFSRLIKAVHKKDWVNAAGELISSKWWGQVQKERRETLYRQILEG